ncbi:AAA family ATPase [Proteobacteria bacterium 005FR1]|nr:AAA family ATPase [Proteobacteria bacterium 005FR1]
MNAERLYLACDPSLISFETTADVSDVDATFGQTRALQAMDFGIGMRGSGYNLFVLASPGSHRHRIVRDFLQGRKSKQCEGDQPADVLSDWVYVNNFADSRKPLAVALPSGEGKDFKRDLDQLVEELQTAIPSAFEGEQYRSRILEINQVFEEKVQARLEEIEEQARKEGLSVVPTPQGFGIAPLREGKLITDAEFGELPEDEQSRTREAIERISDKLRHHLEEVPQWHKQRHEEIKQFNRETTDLAVRGPITRLKEKYREHAKLTGYFNDLHEDVLQNAREFMPNADQPRETPSVDVETPVLRRYSVNVIVGGDDEEPYMPIVYESKPSLQNLLGRVEHIAQFGALITDFSMIRPGALHRANGGYLILDASRLLTEPYAWPALKRALDAEEIRIESMAELMSLVSTVSLEPEPIPLNLKVVLIGDRLLYQMLCMYDPDFADLFKVAADFEDRIARTAENTGLYGHLLASLAHRESLRPFSREAVARMVEHSARLMGDSEKLSMRLRDTTDLLRESDYWAGKAGADTVGRSHVQRAVDARVERADRLRDEMLDETLRRNLLIDTAGAEVGQINGLSVLSLGDFSFGRPVRITATTRIGEGKIVDIEREAELGGHIHSKAVMIVSSYLSAKYAIDTPLSLRASLVFEQSYGGIEGDSASVAETCALISSLAGVPILQNLAVTGSINQHGQVQVIGGVNEKIEGFFDLCRKRGLDGSHGVVIPKDNAKHLMLREDVVAAVRNGNFHVYGVETVDEALSILTGSPAGERDNEGNFLEASVNRRAEDRLVHFAQSRERFEQLSNSDRKQNKPGAND